MPKTSPFERATPESQGIASPAIAAFVDAVQAQQLGLHSFMLLRHGRVVAEAWWRPFARPWPSRLPLRLAGQTTATFTRAYAT